MTLNFDHENIYIVDYHQNRISEFTKTNEKMKLECKYDHNLFSMKLTNL